MSGQDRGRGRDFESAVQQAIEQSENAFLELWQKVNDGLSRLEQATKILQSQSTRVPLSQNQKAESANTSRLEEQLVSIFKQRSQEIIQLFERQQENLSTFNIVLFGRTGAGKSSLIETFARGNGASVSRGESDWTTEIRHLQWNSCRLYDTPGISGWGRTISRLKLEENAHSAVEIADIVLVCFDSQSQQAAEFQKVADWVQKYGKPVIAVLNQRNSRWRMPTLVPNISARRSLSQSVIQHTSNIRDELGRIGLVGVPIVTISTKRALFARATEPFQGPDAETLKKYRSQYGIEQLEYWSNFPALDSLITEAIIQDAMGLRLGMLREKTCGVLRELINELNFWQEQATKASNIIEGTIEGYLRIIGYPPPDNNSSRASFWGDKSQVDLLTQLEELRGEAFQTPVRGEFHDCTTNLLSTYFSQLRATSHAQAEELVIAAFDRKQTLSANDFKTQVFNQAAIEEAAQKVVKEAVNFLERKTKLLARDAKSDFDYEIHSTEARGRAGQSWKWAQYAAQAVGIFSASTLGLLAITNWWNPLGWTAGVAAAVGSIGGIVSWAFSWIANKAQKRAEQERLEKRRSALNQARKSVNETYERLIEQIAQETNRICHEIAGELLLFPLHEAIALRQVKIQTKATQQYLTEILKQIPSRTSAQLLLSQATTSVEQEKFPSDPLASRKLWLGEDWISALIGLEVEDTSDSTLQSRKPDFDFFSQSFEIMLSVFVRISEHLQSGAGATWLEEARNLLSDDQEASIFLDELQVLLEKGKPRLQLCGDYNAGKTSFIKRLLIDVGEPIPETLEVQARPTTSQVTEYEWEGILLVDSPGLQSSRISDTKVALHSFPDATAILYLFQPNLVMGDMQIIDLILKGDEERGILAKLERTFFIINRSDELGIDPYEAPEEYKCLCERKKEELVLALRSRGININLEQVFCMASDPYGLISNLKDANSDHFNLYRDWDGFHSFVNAYYGVRAEILRIGLDLSVLEGGIARLEKLISSESEVFEEAQRKEKYLSRLCQILEEALNESNLVRSNIKAKLERLVEDHAYGLLEDMLSAASEEEIRIQAEQLSQWWEDKGFEHELQLWQDKAQENIDNWYLKIQNAIGERIASAEFKYAFPELAEQFDIPCTDPKNLFKELSDKLGKPMRGVKRDVVYQIGKFFGFKFRPWGAVKLAGRVAKVGAIFGVVGLALDTYSIVNSLKKEGQREKNRKEARNFVKRTSHLLCQSLLEGSKEEKGPVAYLKQRQRNLKGHLEKLKTECQNIALQKEAILKRETNYKRLKISALKHLGF